MATWVWTREFLIRRPHLEYTSPVWNPYLAKDIKLLESVQRLAVKICTRRWNESYERNLIHPSLPTLAQRRDHLTLCYFHKLVNNYFIFQKAPLTHNTNCRFTRAASRNLFVQPFARSSILSFPVLFVNGITYLSQLRTSSLFIFLSIILLFIVNVAICHCFSLWVMLISAKSVHDTIAYTA